MAGAHGADAPPSPRPSPVGGRRPPVARARVRSPLWERRRGAVAARAGGPRSSSTRTSPSSIPRRLSRGFASACERRGGHREDPRRRGGYQRHGRGTGRRRGRADWARSRTDPEPALAAVRVDARWMLRARVRPSASRPVSPCVSSPRSSPFDDPSRTDANAARRFKDGVPSTSAVRRAFHTSTRARSTGEIIAAAEHAANAVFDVRSASAGARRSQLVRVARGPSSARSAPIRPWGSSKSGRHGPVCSKTSANSSAPASAPRARLHGRDSMRGADQMAARGGVHARDARQRRREL